MGTFKNRANFSNVSTLGVVCDRSPRANVAAEQLHSLFNIALRYILKLQKLFQTFVYELGWPGAELTTVAPGNAPYIFVIPATCGEARCLRSACQCLTPSLNVVETRINPHAAPIPPSRSAGNPATSKDGLPASGLSNRRGSHSIRGGGLKRPTK
jgi:hypothetical protein